MLFYCVALSQLHKIDCVLYLQDAENEYDEWVKYSTSFINDVITYAKCLFDNNDLEQLGRTLPTEVRYFHICSPSY